MLQLQGSHAEDLNRNPLLMSVGAIFLVWLTFGFSVWYAFYATLVAGIAGGLTLLTGTPLSPNCSDHLLQFSFSASLSLLFFLFLFSSSMHSLAWMQSLFG